MNILIVEDDPQVTNLLQKMTAAWGYQTISAATGSGAIEAMERQVFDLVLLDIVLPDMHGPDLIPALKGVNPQVMIITMTGYNSRELETSVRRQGIAYYMIKPIQPKELRTVIDHIANTRNTRKEVVRHG